MASIGEAKALMQEAAIKCGEAWGAMESAKEQAAAALNAIERAQEFAGVAFDGTSHELAGTAVGSLVQAESHGRACVGATMEVQSYLIGAQHACELYIATVG
jgi:hypothetical protein